MVEKSPRSKTLRTAYFSTEADNLCTGQDITTGLQEEVNHFQKDVVFPSNYMDKRRMKIKWEYGNVGLAQRCN